MEEKHKIHWQCLAYVLAILKSWSHPKKLLLNKIWRVVIILNRSKNQKRQSPNFRTFGSLWLEPDKKFTFVHETDCIPNTINYLLDQKFSLIFALRDFWIEHEYGFKWIGLSRSWIAGVLGCKAGFLSTLIMVLLTYALRAYVCKLF